MKQLAPPGIDRRDRHSSITAGQCTSIRFRSGGCHTVVANLRSPKLDAVSRDTLSLLDDVIVIDRQSFVRRKDRIPPEIQKVWRDGSFHAIRVKKPDVVLCMGQDRFKESGRAFVVESIGVGRVFEMPRIELCHGLWTRRINACYPSYVVNHNPHVSCLRQLLILEISQASIETTGLKKTGWES